ncbi:MAG: hypothetical protein IJO68_04865 [Clostridia bacterium]|nr:hypothetical protein [Clostridia bacterium]
MRKRNCSKGLIVISFGAGLFLAYCFPSKVLIIALAILLIGAGIILLKT